MRTPTALAGRFEPANMNNPGVANSAADECLELPVDPDFGPVPVRVTIDDVLALASRVNELFGVQNERPEKG
jgi:hypothetical protein